MRGQVVPYKLDEEVTRITPADAGTSRGITQSTCCREDHPRGCGDKIAEMLEDLISEGSPPRMRGQGR